MDFFIRPASPADRQALAQCIAEGFEADFSLLCKDMGKTARAIAGGIQIPRFWVAEREGRLAGAAALSDCRGRAVLTDKAGYRRHFGPLRGRFARLILQKEFESPLNLPPETGYLEFVAVSRPFRRQGAATALLQKIVSSGLYRDYILDVVHTNTGAIQCYEKLGFRRLPEPKKGRKGPGAKIYMRYQP